MLSAFNDSRSSNSIPKELELASAAHKKEMEDLKDQYKLTIESLKRQVIDYKAQNEDLENKVHSLSTDKEALILNTKDQIKDIEAKLLKAEDKVKGLNESKKALQEAMELDTQVKIANMNSFIEKIKAEHMKEMEDMKKKSEASLEDIKYLYQQEKMSLERRIEKMETEMKMREAQKENDNTQQQLCELQANYVNEIQELNLHLDSFKKQSHDEVASLINEREEKQRKVERLEDELNIITEAYTELEAEQQKMITENTQKLKEYQYEINEMQTYIQQLETNEYDLRMLLESREKNKINESYNKQKIDCERRLTQALEESVLKDKYITSLSKQLESALKKCEGVETVMEKGLRVECKKCKELVLIGEFKEHVMKGCDDIGIEIAISQLKSENYKFFPSSTEPASKFISFISP